MIYLFTILLIFNSILYVAKGSWYFVCFLASIVAFGIVNKVKARSVLWLFLVVLLASCGVVLSFFFGFRLFIVSAILFFYFTVYFAFCIQKDSEQRTASYRPAFQSSAIPEISKPTYIEDRQIHPGPKYNSCVFDIPEGIKVKDYYNMIYEYHSAYDQDLLDDPEDGEYPLYTYKNLPCKVELDEYECLVYIHTAQKKWQYVGAIKKTDRLLDCLQKETSKHVEVSGGSTYVVTHGKYEKVWYPLKFRLVIETEKIS